MEEDLAQMKKPIHLTRMLQMVEVQKDIETTGIYITTGTFKMLNHIKSGK